MAHRMVVVVYASLHHVWQKQKDMTSSCLLLVFVVAVVVYQVLPSFSMTVLNSVAYVRCVHSVSVLMITAEELSK